MWLKNATLRCADGERASRSNGATTAPAHDVSHDPCHGVAVHCNALILLSPPGINWLNAPNHAREDERGSPTTVRTGTVRTDLELVENPYLGGLPSRAATRRGLTKEDFGTPGKQAPARPSLSKASPAA